MDEHSFLVSYLSTDNSTEPDRNVIEATATAMNMAHSGNLRYVAVVGVLANGDVVSLLAGKDRSPFTLLGALEAVKDSVAAHIG